MSRELSARTVTRALRAAADVIEADADADEEVAMQPDQDLDLPASGKRRKAVRPAYRPTGPVDELSARRADTALTRAGILPGMPKRGK